MEPVDTEIKTTNMSKKPRGHRGKKYATDEERRRVHLEQTAQWKESKMSDDARQEIIEKQIKRYRQLKINLKWVEDHLKKRGIDVKTL